MGLGEPRPLGPPPGFVPDLKGSMVRKVETFHQNFSLFSVTLPNY